MLVPQSRTNSRGKRGALMAAALMLMIVGGLFMAGWVTLMSTRATQVSWLEKVGKRRAGLETARLLNWQFMSWLGFEPNNSAAANQGANLGVGEGKFNTDNGWTAMNVYTSANTAGGMTTVFPYNATGLRPGSSYVSTRKLIRGADQSNVPNEVFDIDNYNGWQFLKSMPPVLNGDIFCIYRKPEGESTELDVHTSTSNSADSGSTGHHAIWTVEGRTVVRHPPSFFVSSTPSPLRLPFYTRSLYIQSHTAAEPPNLPYATYGTDLGGAPLLPSNLAAVPSTTGPIGGATDQKHQGYLKVVRNDDNPDNSLWHFQNREALAGRTQTVTIDVAGGTNSATEAYWMVEQDTPTYKPPGWPSGFASGKFRVLFIKLDSQYLKNMRIYGVVDQIVFVGQANAAAFASASSMKPVIITIIRDKPSIYTKDIRFERENNRRYVLAFQNTLTPRYEVPKVTFSWDSSPISGTQFRWRCVLVNEYHNIRFNLPATLTQSVRWIGGVMTNWSVKREASSGTNPSRLIFSGDNDSTVPASTNTGPAFATFLPRDAWLESYFLPVAPP